jgi:hypothetical protein
VYNNNERNIPNSARSTQNISRTTWSTTPRSSTSQASSAQSWRTSSSKPSITPTALKFNSATPAAVKRCYNCGEEGHIAIHCNLPKKIPSARLEMIEQVHDDHTDDYYLGEEDFEFYQEDTMKVHHEEKDYQYQQGDDQSLTVEDQKEEKEHKVDDFLEFEGSLQMMEEIGDPKEQDTSRVRGSVGESQVIFQLDSGSSGDYMGEDMAVNLNLPMIQAKKEVKLADSRMKVEVIGIAKNVQIQIKDMNHIIPELQILKCPMQRIILGRPTLRSLNIDIGELFLKALKVHGSIPLEPQIEHVQQEEQAPEEIQIENLSEEISEFQPFQNDLEEYRKNLENLFPIYGSSSPEEKLHIDD